MNYYQHHIGDFNNATRHLSLVERAIYRDLLDMYYDTEQAIDASNIDRLARRVQCSTDEQIGALKYVLDEFFTLEDGAYTNNRCEREIAEFHGKRKQASDAGKASAKKRASKKQQNTSNGSSSAEPLNSENSTTVENPLNENLTDVQPTINHKPLTINQEPLTSNQYKYTFDLNFVNVNLQKSGAQPVDRKFIDTLQSDFEIYYADQHMADNKALIKFVQWIRRNQEREQKQVAAQPFAKQDKWNDYFNNMGQASDELDVTPKKLQATEGVGHA